MRVRHGFIEIKLFEAVMKILRLIPSLINKTTKIDALIEGKLLTSVIYDFDGDFSPAQDVLGNVALVAFLPYAMQHGLDLVVEAAVDEDLLLQLDEAQDAWTRWHPSIFSRVDVASDIVTARTNPGMKSAIAAFSGGLDASYAMVAHKNGLIGRRCLDLKAAVLVHGFDIPIDKPDWFSSAKKRAEAVANSFDLPLIAVRTNWRSLDTPWGLTFIFGVSSVMHHFKGAYDCGVIAADESYENEVLGWGSNSITNPLMSGSSFPIRFTGAGMSRTQKAGAVSSHQAILDNIRVCWERPDSPTNCGCCEKCIRTKLNFLAAGVDSVPALGSPVTAKQLSTVTIENKAIWNFFAEMSELPWHGRLEIKEELIRLTKLGITKRSKIIARIERYKKSIRKRGFPI